MVLVGEERKKSRRPKKSKVKTTFNIRVFYPDGKELVNPRGLKTEFHNEKIAEEFVEFYEIVMPKAKFVIEEKGIF